jgi:hypothetical protein
VIHTLDCPRTPSGQTDDGPSNLFSSSSVYEVDTVVYTVDKGLQNDEGRTR